MKKHAVLVKDYYTKLMWEYVVLADTQEEAFKTVQSDMRVRWGTEIKLVSVKFAEEKE